MLSFAVFEKILVLFLFLLSIPILKALLNAPFVPTPQKTVRKMLREANLKPGQVVYDLGCGDGRFVRLAAREYGVTAIGIELNPLVYLYAKLRSLGHKNEKILCQNLFKVNLGDADVVICYLLPKTMAGIEEKLNAELKGGAKVISHAFRFQHWKIAHTIKMNNVGSGSIHVYCK